MKSPLLASEHKGEIPMKSHKLNKSIGENKDTYIAFLDPANDKPIGFPSMLAIPALWHVAVTALLTVVTVLCLTIWKEPLESKFGVTSDMIIKYGSIPVVSVGFTYCHIWLALWMTFYPIHFFGCCQIKGTNVGLGWQGIIPNKAEKMARKAVKLMTEQLIDVREIFSRIDPIRVAAELEPIMNDSLAVIINRVAMKHSPGVWEVMPSGVKKELVRKAAADSPVVIKKMMEDVKANITECFDIEHMVVTALVKNKELLNMIFIRCGYKELVFIRNSGAYMGFVFGVLQMICWIFYQGVWLLPAIGFVVGYLTNYLALKMIFWPIDPIFLCCGCRLHGLFLRRQDEVAQEYGRVIAREVLNSKAIIQAIISGPTTDKLFAIVHGHVKQACDDFAGVSKPFIALTVGSETYQKVKVDICDGIVDLMPAALSHVEEYTNAALDLENTLTEKMQCLSSHEFEGLLHPVFEEDEWKLILMGGVLGVAIGLLQAFFLQP